MFAAPSEFKSSNAKRREKAREKKKKETRSHEHWARTASGRRAQTELRGRPRRGGATAVCVVLERFCVCAHPALIC